jgi:hypothetical protein
MQLEPRNEQQTRTSKATWRNRERIVRQTKQFQNVEWKAEMKEKLLSLRIKCIGTVTKNCV